VEYALKGILSRPQSLSIRVITYDIFVENDHDPACALRGVSFLSNFANQYRHALLVFDYKGCGIESSSRQMLQTDLNKQFARTSWDDRGCAIVIEPELEAWVWSDSPQVDVVLDWTGREPKLRSWLRENGYVGEGEVKPRRPKEAFEGALRKSGMPRSASLFLKLAQQASLHRCQDAAFTDLLSKLRTWFPEMENRH
jgi:hypothetical protein